MMPHYTYNVYIDESGDEGFSFGKGSSEWFVLSAVIVKKENDFATVSLVDAVRSQLEKPDKKPLHFRDLRHEHRLPFIDRISQADLKIISVFMHKPSLEEPEKFHERYRLYFYSVRFLLERVSWYCKDHHSKHDDGGGRAELIFSNRSGMSYEELGNHLRHIRDNTDFFEVRIDWNHISPEAITAYSAGKRMGLQIADAVASGSYYAVEQRKGYTESRYLRMLKPVVYHHQSRYMGYGLKVWPKNAAMALSANPRHKEIVECYGE